MSPNPNPPRAAAFTKALKELHRSCGEPSYAEIQRLARSNGESISKGAITNMLSGATIPTSPILRTFVRANLVFDDPNRDPTELEAELRRWRGMRIDARQPTGPNTNTTSPDVAVLSSPFASPDLDTGPALGRSVPTTSSPSGNFTRLTDSLRIDADPHSTHANTRPRRSDLQTPRRQGARNLLDDALTDEDAQGRVWADAKFGCYAFYDFDGEPIYVGQTNERLRTRVRRHLTNQRTDAVAMNILDVQEVAELELWPLWALQDTNVRDPDARALLDATEYTVYRKAIYQTKLGALLNEKIPNAAGEVELPPSRRFLVVDDQTRSEAKNPDVRIARNAEMLRRLSTTILERGQPSMGARHALLVRSARLTQLVASRLTFVSGVPADDDYLMDLRMMLRSLSGYAFDRAAPNGPSTSKSS
ncbi:GIY-YIG nuclease family protein [Nocardia sp. NPDC049526]|uniref:GIY-YIG nuclease family protein n=1 Tax=Nocardia sp. NPDC049526 TaxID=3364316 RepID=UPI0037AF68E1